MSWAVCLACAVRRRRCRGKPHAANDIGRNAFGDGCCAGVGNSLIYGNPPFTQTLSNTTPLVFGMTADAAALALGTPLQYVRGRPGDEIFLAIRTIGGSGLFPRDDRLFLQFRHGRLTGFKGDWGRNWMWR